MYFINFIFLFHCFCVDAQHVRVNFVDYLKPNVDTLVYNCVYNSFHANGSHETITLAVRRIKIGEDTAFYLSSRTDTSGQWSWLNHFTGSAMIFKIDTVLFAALHEGRRIRELKRMNFQRFLPPLEVFSEPYEIAGVKWDRFVNRILIKNFRFEDLTIGDTTLKKCLRLNLIAYDRLKRPDDSTIWLYHGFGVVKWIRSTGRMEVLDIRQSR